MSKDNNINEHFENENHTSKSQLKREMHALQDLGEQLTQLSAKDYVKAPISDNLREQINIAKGIKTGNGKRRQIQFIGKLIRSIEKDEIDKVIAFLENIKSGDRTSARQFKSLEILRDKLINEGDPAINAFVQNKPTADRQLLRQLVRSANKELKQEKPPMSSRKLFKYLRTLSDDRNQAF